MMHISPKVVRVGKEDKLTLCSSPSTSWIE